MSASGDTGRKQKRSSTVHEETLERVPDAYFAVIGTGKTERKNKRTKRVKQLDKPVMLFEYSKDK